MALLPPNVTRLLETTAGPGGASLLAAELPTSGTAKLSFNRDIRPILSENCFACHGPDVRQDVRAEIARYYPTDKAIGFRVGELRGAVSLTQIVEE